MDTFFLICLLLGATLMVCQFLLGLLGLGHHDTDVGGGHDIGHDVGGHDAHAHDAAHDAHAAWFVGVLTFRSLVAALTFFGLAGLTALVNFQLDPGPALAVALAAGCAALLLVAYMMRALHRLKAEGTARIERAVGLTGTVYIPVPPQKGGAGRVMLNLQNRTVEYRAVSAQDRALPTGSKVVVTAIVSSDTVEVAPAP
jgi:hypothetical protein